MRVEVVIALLFIIISLGTSCSKKKSTPVKLDVATELSTAQIETIGWGCPTDQPQSATDQIVISSWHPYNKYLSDSDHTLLLRDEPLVVVDNQPAKSFNIHSTENVTLRSLELTGFKGDEIDIHTNSLSNISVYETSLRDLFVDNFDSSNKLFSYPPLSVTGDVAIGTLIDTLAITQKRLKSIHLSKIKKLQLINCIVTDTAVIECPGLDTVIIKDLVFKHDADLLVLPNVDSSKKKIIFIASSDASKFYFDYSKYHFVYFPASHYNRDRNRWESDVIEVYNDIIKSQTRMHNQQGIKDASVELGIFRDTLLTVGPVKYGKLISHIKFWWNDYGFDKGKVIVASCEIFIVFYLLNLVIFRKLLSVYDFSGIKEALEAAYRQKGFFYRFSYRCLHCLVYSGFVFYGLKFDVKNLNVKKIGYVFILVFEYVVGIVSLAYIANYIITK